MEVVGVTVFTPEVGTSPTPSIVTVVASVVRQLSTTWSPAEMVEGVAVSWAVGAGEAAGGAVAGIGGDGCFLWQPATVDYGCEKNNRKQNAIELFQVLLLYGLKAPKSRQPDILIAQIRPALLFKPVCAPLSNSHNLAPMLDRAPRPRTHTWPLRIEKTN